MSRLSVTIPYTRRSNLFPYTTLFRSQEEEDVHPAGDPAEPDVVDGDQDQCQGAQTVQLPAEGGPGAAGGFGDGPRFRALLCLGAGGLPGARDGVGGGPGVLGVQLDLLLDRALDPVVERGGGRGQDRKSTRLNSSHVAISYAVVSLQ